MAYPNHRGMDLEKKIEDLEEQAEKFDAMFDWIRENILTEHERERMVEQLDL